jgi:hypothetical protein
LIEWGAISLRDTPLCYYKKSIDSNTNFQVLLIHHSSIYPNAHDTKK